MALAKFKLCVLECNVIYDKAPPKAEEKKEEIRKPEAAAKEETVMD